MHFSNYLLLHRLVVTISPPGSLVYGLGQSHIAQHRQPALLSLACSKSSSSKPARLQASHLKPWWLWELSAKKKSNEQTCRDFNCTRVFIRPSSSIPWALILAYDQHLCWKHCSYLFPQGHRNGAAAAALEDSFFELISVRSIFKTTCGCVCWHRNVICFKGN